MFWSRICYYRGDAPCEGPENIVRHNAFTTSASPVPGPGKYAITFYSFIMAHCLGICGHNWTKCSRQTTLAVTPFISGWHLGNNVVSIKSGTFQCAHHQNHKTLNERTEFVYTKKYEWTIYGNRGTTHHVRVWGMICWAATSDGVCYVQGARYLTRSSGVSLLVWLK